VDRNTQASNPTPETEKPLLDARLEQFLDQKAADVDDETGERSGTYVRDLERVVPKWVDWMNSRGVETLDRLDEKQLAAYAEYLARRESADGIAAATAHKYYNLVSAYLTYCRKWGEIDDNPAQAALPQESLPDQTGKSSKDQQFWSPQQRQQLVGYVDDQAATAIDEDGSDAVSEVRDRAFVTLVGYSAVRGAEILRVPRGADQRPDRQGATWGDLNLDDETIDVLGKSQEHEQAPLTDKPVAALERWRTVLDPATDDWPLFPTMHAPTLWGDLRDQLVECEHDDVDGLLDPYDDPMDAYRRYNCVPPALTTEGGRSILKRLTDAAGIDADSSSKDYLTLHGARRGVGEMYYREEGPAAAQRALRHADPQTTSEMYSHIEASELSDIGSQVFDDE
jgi:integrase